MINVSDTLLNALAGRISPPVAAPKSQTGTQENTLRRGRRALLNYLPDYDTLNSLIAQAREALAKGIFWDRGSIINIIL